MTVVKRNKRAKSDPELLKLADSLLANYKKPEDLIGENGLPPGGADVDRHAHEHSG